MEVEMENSKLFSLLLSDHVGSNLLIKGPISRDIPGGFHHQVTHGSVLVKLIGIRWNSFSQFLLDDGHDLLVDPIHETQTVVQTRRHIKNGQATQHDVVRNFIVVDVLLHEGETYEKRILLHLHENDVALQ
jgi:hypothetical protein